MKTNPWLLVLYLIESEAVPAKTTHINPVYPTAAD